MTDKKRIHPPARTPLSLHAAPRISTRQRGQGPSSFRLHAWRRNRCHRSVRGTNGWHDADRPVEDCSTCASYQQRSQRSVRR